MPAEVAEYTFEVRNTALFLASDDIWNFRDAFFTGSQPLTLFLAENGVDV